MTCKTHPDAPHGFVRGASHSEDRYVCECEFWEEPKINERIRDLKEQALIWAVETLDPDALNDNEWGVAIDGKFAELIVRECVQVCADRGAHHDGLYSAWADDCSKRIGKHFGVEE